jgi:SNF2 family DNA or RNA helicase
LTAASLAVFYSVGYNYAEYEQATARTHRIGQTQKCTYIHLLVENSVDAKVMAALEAKEDIAKGLVDGWRKFFS